MHTDIRGQYLTITHMRQRRVRGRLFAFSARQIALAVAIILGAAIGFGVLTERAHSAPGTAGAPPGFAWARGG